MRQSYLKQGGQDQGILAQLTELEMEAMAAESKSGTKSRKPSKRMKQFCLTLTVGESDGYIYNGCPYCELMLNF